MNTFITLLRREWLQHRLGWLILLSVPTVLTLGLVLLGNSAHIQLNGDDISLADARRAAPALQTLLITLIVMVITFALTVLAVGFQLPGLARRDVQDRSIEFWLSLPVGHAQSVGATLTAHSLLLPVAALLAGLVGGQLVAAAAAIVMQGPVAWLTQPWPAMLLGLAALLTRLVLGVALALTWLSPLILLTMAASAWLKRWGLPVVMGLLFAGVPLLDHYLGQDVFKTALTRLMDESRQALITTSPLPDHLTLSADVLAILMGMPAWALRDLGNALSHLASAFWLLATALGAGGFGLLVLRRQRGA